MGSSLSLRFKPYPVATCPPLCLSLSLSVSIPVLFSFSLSPLQTLSGSNLSTSIDVGGGPSGPSIEGPFCRTVHLCCTLGERKVGKKKQKNEKNEEKKKVK